MLEVWKAMSHYPYSVPNPWNWQYYSVQFDYKGTKSPDEGCEPAMRDLMKAKEQVEKLFDSLAGVCFLQEYASPEGHLYYLIRVYYTYQIAHFTKQAKDKINRFAEYNRIMIKNVVEVKAFDNPDKDGVDTVAEYFLRSWSNNRRPQGVL